MANRPSSRPTPSDASNLPSGCTGAESVTRLRPSAELAFFYHSGTGREIVGIAEVVREAYPDPSAAAGPWVCVDLRAVGADARGR